MFTYKSLSRSTIYSTYDKILYENDLIIRSYIKYSLENNTHVIIPISNQMQQTFFKHCTFVVNLYTNVHITLYIHTHIHIVWVCMYIISVIYNWLMIMMLLLTCCCAFFVLVLLLVVVAIKNVKALSLLVFLQLLFLSSSSSIWGLCMVVGPPLLLLKTQEHDGYV